MEPWNHPVTFVGNGNRHTGPLQGYLAHRKIAPPWDRTVGLCLGLCSGPGGGGRFLMSEVTL